MNNQQNFYYYKAPKQSPEISIDKKFKIRLFSPTFYSLKLHSGKEGKFLLYLFWYILTLGRYKILYIYDQDTGRMAHFSNIIPKIFKYSFMGIGDMFIG